MHTTAPPSKREKKLNIKDDCAPTTSCACDMNDHVKTGEEKEQAVET